MTPKSDFPDPPGTSTYARGLLSTDAAMIEPRRTKMTGTVYTVEHLGLYPCYSSVRVYTLFFDASVLTDLAGVSFHPYMPYPREHPVADTERPPPSSPSAPLPGKFS